jgi:hypothetical protein
MQLVVITTPVCHVLVIVCTTQRRIHIIGF